ncbi:Pyridoxal phosphate-dependent decarboxylase [Fusarium oxysporum f. sp. vasinfectum]|nr:Pyridoxal phosphate-dependent decarboxylase [Fusarium oxysporum f. sp. vasinfectum]
MGSLYHNDELEAVCSALQSITQRLASTTQDVQNDPIIKVAQPSDVPYLQKIGTPGQAHSIDQVLQEAFTAFDHRMRVNHPRFMGFIPSPTSPVAWLGDIVASAFNALGASKLQASGPVVIEKTLIEWLAGRTHYSVAKAMRMLGFDKEQIRRLPADEDFRLDPALLAQTIQEDRKAGLVPFLVVGTCGTTNTGAIDPLPEIAEICKREQIWLHVDGAYGASATLSATRHEIVDGLKYADSMSWDAHKWLFQTYSCGLLLVKDKANLVRSFANEGDYLRDGVAIEDEDIPNFWNYSMELTRPASRVMKLWFTLRVIGVERIGEMIDHGFDLAERAEEELRKLPDWEIVSSASLGVITFRYAPEGLAEDELETINTGISKSLISSNKAGILTTKVRGKVALRICALSPQLALDDMSDIIHEANLLATKSTKNGNGLKH